ncbi:MAG: HNH endonuclease [Candidatus Dadabacteria bacterium]|nr:HNH endonuclease [Candidatus Dadabacteria bacterium]
MRAKYTKELLEKLVKDSVSIAQVLRKLGLKAAGGSHHHISLKLKKFKIDTSHFLGQSANCGENHKGGKKLKWQEVLILRSSGNRQKAHVLRRALIEFGRDYRCEKCKISKWKNKPLFLHVDHINGNWLDDRVKNLRFMCPNCHSQTPNYCGSKGYTDIDNNAAGARAFRLKKKMAE